jgi:hypothetical protein
MSYNYLTDIENIYNAKVGYNKATTAEEKKRQNEIANAARKNLEAYGYGDIAKQLSATGADATAARKILEQYKAPTTTVTDTNTKYDTNTLKTGINNEAYNNRVSSASTKNDVMFNTIQNDHSNVNKKYEGLYDYANSDITQTDEYKSTFNNIMPSYTLSAMQGRENELASGSASNGGNIDSFAAANALRQQTAITAKGQALAHQMGLEAANSRVNNVNNILSNLGVYNSSVYSAMNDSINNDRNMYNDITTNEQTALNNETARLVEQANVTGYTPTEWTIKNDAVYSQFLNPDGTFKKEMEGTDIQALINSTTDADTKKKLAVVRAKKVLSDYGKYGKYLNEGDIAFMENQQTEAGRQFDKNSADTRYVTDVGSGDTRYVTDKEVESNKYNTDASERMNTANNQNALDQIAATTSGEKDVLKLTKELSETGGTQLTDEQIKTMDSAVKNINSLFKTHSSNIDGTEILIIDGKGKYRFNPNVSTNAWDDLVVEQVLANKALSDEEKASIIASLDIDTKSMQYLLDKYE